MTLQLCTTDSGPQSQLGMVVGQVRIKVWGISESTSSTARDARERFHSCHQGNAGELEWARSRAFCFPHLLNLTYLQSVTRSRILIASARMRAAPIDQIWAFF